MSLLLGLLKRVSLFKWIGIGSVLTAVLVLVGVYVYVDSLEHRIEILTANNATLRANRDLQDAAIKAQTGIIDQWAKSQQELLIAVGRLAKVQEDATAETRRLNEIFTGHDLGALALAKPGLITRRINAGSHRADRMLECASGDQSACVSARGKDAGRSPAAAGAEADKAARRKVDGGHATDAANGK